MSDDLRLLCDVDSTDTLTVEPSDLSLLVMCSSGGLVTTIRLSLESEELLLAYLVRRKEEIENKP